MHRVLVFGQSGQIARSLNDIRAPGFHIRCVGRPHGDITSAASIALEFETFQPDIVVNAAAYTAVDKAEEERDLAYAVNCDGPHNLARECRRANVPLIHYSTDCVFDGSGERAWIENDITAPLNVYGESKLAGEHALADTWGKIYILRTSWVYSPYGQNFVKTMLRLGRERTSLRVVDDQIGNPTYAADIAEATLKLIKHAFSTAPHFGTYHLAGSGATSRFDFANMIFENASNLFEIKCIVDPVPSSAYPTPALRPRNSRLDSSKLSYMHGIVLPSLPESLRRCLRALSEGG